MTRHVPRSSIGPLPSASFQSRTGRQSVARLGRRPTRLVVDEDPVWLETEGISNQDEAQAVAAVIDRLAKRVPDTPRTQVEEIVTEEYSALSGGPIRDYVPVLIERAAKVRLSS